MFTNTLVFNVRALFSDSLSVGNSTVNTVVNSTSFTGTSNNTSYVGSVTAANVVSNAQLQANLTNYQTTSGLAANVLILTANDTTHVGSVSAANVVSNAQLQSNLSSYQTIAGLASNVAVLTANNTSFVGTVSAANVVSNAQLQANLANYQTTAGLASNVAILTANNANNLNDQPAEYYTNATNISTGTLSYDRLGANVVNTSSSFTITGVYTYNANLIIGAGLSANGSFGSSGYFLYTNSSGIYWGPLSSPGSNTGVMFNDSGLANTSDGLTFNKTSNNLTVANTLIVKAIYANGSIGSDGYVLTSNGSVAYWSNAAGGGGSTIVAGKVYSKVNAIAGQNVFTTSSDYSTGLIDVYYNGVHLSTSDFSEVNSTAIQLNFNANANDVIELSGYSSISPVPVGTASGKIYSRQTAVNNQSIFTTSAPYTSGLVDVYYNGVHLSTVDYAEVNSTAIQLTTPADNNAIVEISAYSMVSPTPTGTSAGRIYAKSIASTNNQTIFTSTNEFSSGLIDVYYNGVHLTTSDYSEVNSTAIQLTFNSNINDQVEIVGYYILDPLTFSMPIPGSNTYIIFNDQGNANSSSGLTFDKESNTLNVGITSNKSFTANTWGNTSQIIDSWSISTYRSAQYFINISDDSANSYQSSTLMILQNDTPYLTEFGILTSNGILGEFSATSNATHVLLNFLPVSLNTVIKASKQMINI